MDNKLTLPETGIEVRIRKVSPLLITELERQFPQPRPPVNYVDYGDGKKVAEENKADPDYEKTLDEYNRQHEARLRHLLIARGVFYELSADNVREVKDLKKFWKDSFNKDLEGTDLEVFVAYLAVATPEDMNLLISAILNRAQPTPETISEAEDRFRPSLSGTESNGHTGSDERSIVQSGAGVASSR